MIRIEQELSESDYRKAYSFWYDSFRASRIDGVVGMLLIIFGLILLVITLTFPTFIASSTAFLTNTTRLWLSVFGMVFGFYLYKIKKVVAIKRLIASIRTGKHFSASMKEEIEINECGAVTIVNTTASSSTHLNAFAGYSSYPGYIALFLTRSGILILNKNGFIIGDLDDLLQMLTQFKVRRVNNPKKDIADHYGSGTSLLSNSFFLPGSPLFISPGMSHFMSWFAKSVFSLGFMGSIWLTTPATMFLHLEAFIPFTHFFRYLDSDHFFVDFRALDLSNAYFVSSSSFFSMISQSLWLALWRDSLSSRRFLFLRKHANQRT